MTRDPLVEIPLHKGCIAVIPAGDLWRALPDHMKAAALERGKAVMRTRQSRRRLRHRIEREANR